MKQNKFIKLLTVTVITTMISLALFSFSVFASNHEHILKVGVKGMVCAFCAQGIEKNFMAQKEVASIEVSLANKFVLIKFKDGQTIPKEKVAAILKDSGYEAVFGG